ncbi:MAG: response regulator transcription factor [Actinomycetota bacterium]|jgi:DNA-binding NarL/FixJ family response regulator|nr:response regulator transcription factor [Actinomycetota bacterium]
MTSVVIVDDQALVRDGLRLTLELAGIEVVGEAADGDEAVELVVSIRPDVVLMDIRMPRTDGIEATRRIMAAGVPSRVLVLTTFDLDEHVYAALRAGAAGFLLKDAGGDRLVAAVREAAAGETPVAGEVLGRLIDHFVESPPASIAASGVVTALSKRELEVLRLVGAGRSNAEIAGDLFISLATVKSHLRHILAKLGLRDRVQVVVLAHEAGLAGRTSRANPQS